MVLSLFHEKIECINSQLRKRTKLILVFLDEIRLLTTRILDLFDEWQGNCGMANISTEGNSNLL